MGNALCAIFHKMVVEKANVPPELIGNFLHLCGRNMQMYFVTVKVKNERGEVSDTTVNLKENFLALCDLGHCSNTEWHKFVFGVKTKLYEQLPTRPSYQSPWKEIVAAVSKNLFPYGRRRESARNNGGSKPYGQEDPMEFMDQLFAVMQMERTNPALVTYGSAENVQFRGCMELAMKIEYVSGGVRWARMSGLLLGCFFFLMPDFIVPLSLVQRGWVQCETNARGATGSIAKGYYWGERDERCGFDTASTW